jgi:hypothetical protein
VLSRWGVKSCPHWSARTFTSAFPPWMRTALPPHRTIEC